MAQRRALCSEAGVQLPDDSEDRGLCAGEPELFIRVAPRPLNDTAALGSDVDVDVDVDGDVCMDAMEGVDDAVSAAAMTRVVDVATAVDRCVHVSTLLRRCLELLPPQRRAAADVVAVARQLARLLLQARRQGADAVASGFGVAGGIDDDVVPDPALHLCVGARCTVVLRCVWPYGGVDPAARPWHLPTPAGGDRRDNMPVLACLARHIVLRAVEAPGVTLTAVAESLPMLRRADVHVLVR